MAWTSPRTWVTGEVVTAALFNVHVRDNHLALSQHAHGGASGDGSSELGNLVKATLTDGGAAPAPGAGLTVIYVVSGVVRKRDGAGGADTALSVVGHTHTFVEDQIDRNSALGADDAAQAAGRAMEIASGGSAKDVSQALTLTDSGIVIGSGSAVKSTGSDADHEQILIIDGVSVTTIGNPASGLENGVGLMNVNGSRAVSSGSRTTTNRLLNNDSAIWAVGRDSGVEAIGVII